MSKGSRRSWRIAPTRYDGSLCLDEGENTWVRLAPRDLRVVRVPPGKPERARADDWPQRTLEHVLEIRLRLVDIDGRLISSSTIYPGFDPEPAA